MAEVHVHDAGLTWMVAEEAMQRASHALAVDGRVWLVDPFDDTAALAQAGEIGEIAGVIQLLDRHDRDCAELASRFDVPHHRLPDAGRPASPAAGASSSPAAGASSSPAAGGSSSPAAGASSSPASGASSSPASGASSSAARPGAGPIPGAPFDVLSVLDVPGWHERALWWPAERVLVAAETVGTGPYFAVGPGPAGIHPFMRLHPSKVLRPYEPALLLAGHGPPVTHDAAPALHEAYARSWRDAVKVPLSLLRAG